MHVGKKARSAFLPTCIPESLPRAALCQRSHPGLRCAPAPLPGFYWTDEKTREAPLYPMPPGQFAPAALASAPTPPLLPGFYWMDENTREAPLYPHAFPKACPGPRSASALTPARAAPPHPATAPWLLLEDEKMRFAHFLILQ